jgi:hypothetical protein
VSNRNTLLGARFGLNRTGSELGGYMRTVVCLTFGIIAIVAAAASTASADVHLTMQGGRVTLVAKDATVRQILAEWERVGQTKVINAERVAGGLVNIELTNVPEQKALDVILRSVSGVVLAPRAAATGSQSTFERIIVMPPSIAPPNNLPPSTAQAAPFQPRIPDDDQDERPIPGAVPQNRGGPVFVFPQPQTQNPQMPNQPMPNQPMPTVPTGAFGGQPQQPTLVYPPQGVPAAPPVTPNPAVPTGVPGGVAVPGMVAPAPAPTPGQPGFAPPPLRPQNP